jgi:phenylacetate-CoA ligase
MRQRQYWSADQIREWQHARLHHLLQHAADKVPFYRERFRELGLDPRQVAGLEDLKFVPITTKRDIQSHFPDKMLSQRERNADWRFLGTRGTTNRIIVAQDFLRRDHARATELFVLTEECSYRVGKQQVVIPPDACSAVCGTEGLRDTSVIRHLAKMLWHNRAADAEAWSDLRGLVMSNWVARATVLPPFGPRGTHIANAQLADYLREIRRVRPELLWGLPEYLLMLARHVERGGEGIGRVPVVRPMGAKLTAEAKLRIERSLDCTIREHYGSLELGGVAFDCARRCGMHVLEDQFHVEVLRNGRPVGDGEVGSVVITDWYNFSMPLVRYQIGDMARLTRVRCDCGRTTSRITIEGRLEDTFVLDSQEVLTPAVVSEHFSEEVGVDDFQLLEHGSGSWELRVVPSNGCVDRQALLRRGQALLGQDSRLTIREVQSILPEASGKFRHCKSKSYQRLLDSAPRVQREECSLHTSEWNVGATP